MKSDLYFQTPRDLRPTPLRRLADSLTNLLFPENCLCCGFPVARLQDRGACDACWDKVLRLRIEPPWCPSCGLPYASMGEPHLCGDCILRPPPFSGARAYGYYSSELRRFVHAFKFSGRQSLADLFSPLLASTFCRSWSRCDADVVVPVPLHPARLQERGFNQSAVLARRLGQLLGVAPTERALYRVRDTAPQVGLTDQERTNNVRRAFDCPKPELIEGRRILLVDDVMTTGATASAASAALLEGGARRVWVLALARAVPGRMQ